MSKRKTHLKMQHRIFWHGGMYMKTPFFTGACTALVTPFLNGQVNYPMLDILLQRQIDAGLEAVVICGTTGESSTLSDTEKIELFRRAKAFTGDRIKIIAGTGSNDTAHTVELSKAAQEIGADGLLVVSTYYNKATQEGLFRHYLSEPPKSRYTHGV